MILLVSEGLADRMACVVGGRAGTGVCAVGSWGGGIGVWALGSLGKGRERKGTESGKRKLLLDSKGTSILGGDGKRDTKRMKESE